LFPQNLRIDKAFDVRGSVHRSIIYAKNPTRCKSVSKFIPYLYKAQHVSGDKTPHHQEPNTALAACSFAYVEDC